MNTKKIHLAGEAALIIVLLINSLGVDLMSKAASEFQPFPLYHLFLILPFQYLVSVHGIIFSRHCL